MQNLSRQERGRLGGEKTKEIIAEITKEKIRLYDLNPNLCKQCSSSLDYNHRKNIFCSKSCSASFNNQFRRRKDVQQENILVDNTDDGNVIWSCLSCNTEHKTKPYKVGYYCNHGCQINHKHFQNVENWIHNEAYLSKGSIKRYLRETFGYKCSVCGIDNWCGKSIVLELEHKDGNSDNNRPDNVCLICPNCHSQTDTYKAKNKGNGRHSRRLRYAKGLSF